MAGYSICRRGLGLAIACLLWSACASAAQAALFARSTNDLQTEARAAGAEGRQLAVFLTLPDCPGCREMDERVHGVPALEKSFSRKFRSVRIDISRTEPLIDPAGRATTPAAFAQRLRAVATPSHAFFSANGETIFRHTGTLDAKGFRQLALYVAEQRYEQQPFVEPARQEAALRLNAEAVAPTLPARPDFALAATDGKTRSLADFRGLAVALAVGYTQCPDVCPTTLAEMKAAVEALPASLRPQVQLLFATLDPERDGLPLLKEYAAAFKPAGGRPILGLRGNPEQTAALIGQLQLVAEKQPSASMGYTLDHTAGIFLFDRRGRLLGLSPYGQPLAKLSRDMAVIATDAQATRHQHLAQH